MGRTWEDALTKPRAYPCHYVSTGVAAEHPDGDACTCRPIRLSLAQQDFLEHAVTYTNSKRHDTAGMIAKGASRRTAAKLESLGLVELVGHGPHIDAEEEDHWKEWPIYAVTERGRVIDQWLRPETAQAKP